MRNGGTSYKECTQCGWDCRPCRCQIESAARQEEENKKIAAKECTCGACCQKKCKCRHDVDWTSPETRVQLAALKKELEEWKGESDANLELAKQTQLMVWEQSAKLDALGKDARVCAEYVNGEIENIYEVSGGATPGEVKIIEAASRIIEATKEG